MEKKGISIVVALVLLSAGSVFSLEESLVFGREDQWSSLYLRENIVIRTGFRGFADLLPQDHREPVRDTTDLLLTFDRIPFADDAGRYQVVTRETVTDQRAADHQISERMARVGDAAAVFGEAGSGGIELQPRPGAAFHPGTFWDSLLIEFWMHPALLRDGETILSWEGARVSDAGVVPQRLQVTVRNRRLHWEFDNVFVPPSGGQARIAVGGYSGLVPRRWSHHQLRYDARLGKLEYLVDGVSEGITFTTSSGAERGDAFSAFVGEVGSGGVRIAPDFHGLLDEMRVVHAAQLPDVYQPYAAAPQVIGVAETRPIPLGDHGGRIVGIDATWSAPGDSDVAFAYRVADQRTTANTLSGEWRSFDPDRPLQELGEGRYVQLRVELLPDGAGRDTPRVSDVTVRYDPRLPPPVPTGVRASVDGSAVELEWNPVRGYDVAGYLVYYGERPGSYFGDDAQLGRSPIDVGDRTRVRLEGLTGGRAYYFAVAAFGRYGPEDASGLSREVSARPTGVGR